MIEAICYDAASVHLAKLSYREGSGYPSKHISEKLGGAALLDQSDHIGLPVLILGYCFLLAKIDGEQL